MAMNLALCTECLRVDGWFKSQSSGQNSLLLFTISVVVVVNICANLVEFLQPVLLPPVHHLQTVGEGGDNGRCGGLEGDALSLEVHSAEI